MGLSAYVNCACYRRGTARPFPLPPLETFFRFDVDGVLGLDLPYEGYEIEHNTVQSWMECACDHEDMELISQSISNWTGYLAFLQSLTQIGWKFFPTLKQELPRKNDGYTGANSAYLILRELELFSKLVEQSSNYFLINTLSGEAIQEYLAALKGIFLYADNGTGLQMGIDPQGFFILCSDANNPQAKIECFRATKFEQRIIQRDDKGKPTKVDFYCAETESHFVTNAILTQFETMGAGQLLLPHYPTAMHVEKRGQEAFHFDYILKPLRRICQAAVLSGNPIVWF